MRRPLVDSKLLIPEIAWPGVLGEKAYEWLHSTLRKTIKALYDATFINNASKRCILHLYWVYLRMLMYLRVRTYVH